MRDQIERRQRNMEFAIEEAEKDAQAAGWSVNQSVTSAVSSLITDPIEEDDMIA
jgi:hypothetical protein